ncbi:MAG: hypothetical protein PHV37_02105 [Candidatus Gastranaerophilales bacterium]|nr:hypothetical protein [Candidatus Gastranaerophilales bacterium]
MINVNNTTSNNVFKDFPELYPKAQTPQVANSPLNDKKKDTVELKSDEHIASVKVSDEIKQSHKGGILAATLGTTILTAGIFAVVLTKGAGLGNYKKVNALLEELNDRIYQSSLSKKSKNIFNKVDLALANGMKKVLSGMKAVANFTAIKDSAADKLLRSNPKTAKVADGITHTFKKVATKAVDGAYDKAHILSDDFYGHLLDSITKINNNSNIDLTQMVSIKGQTKPLVAWLEDIKSSGKVMQNVFTDGFSKKSRLEREVVREKSLTDLPAEVWDTLWGKNGGIFNFKGNANKFKSYITEDLSIDGKITLRTSIEKSRRRLTNNVSHNVDAVRTNVRELTDKLLLEDDAARASLRQISQKMNVYEDITGAEELVRRQQMAKDIVADFEEFIKGVKSSDLYDAKTKKAIDKQVKYITNDVLLNDKKGAMQDIMTIVNGLNHQSIVGLDGEDIKVFEDPVARMLDRKSHKITKSINKATTLEANDLYDKFAEFKVGSAPTDLLGLVFPLGLGIGAVSKAKDKNEKVSTTLTTGIPILGTIGSMIVGTTKMLSGPKNMALSLGIGAVLNLVGEACNKLYLEYQDKKSLTQIALDAYKNNPLFNQQMSTTKK